MSLEQVMEAGLLQPAGGAEAIPLLSLPTQPAENVRAPRDPSQSAPAPQDASPAPTPGNEREKALRLAVRLRDVTAVKRLLAEGVSLTCRDNVQMTPLHLCIQQYCYWNFQHNIPRTKCLPDEMEIIEEILAAAVRAENKRDILNSLDKDGRSPLYLAIECGYFEVVQALLRSEVNMNRVSDKNETALHIAVQRPSILGYFLYYHDIKNSVDKNGYAAIHTAAKFDVVESLKLLLKQFGHKQLTWGTWNESTVLHVVAEYGSNNVAKFLLQTPYEPKLEVGFDGETPLNRSAKQGHKALTALLLKHGFVLSDKAHQGRTAVEQIARRFTDPLKFFEHIFDECITENDPSPMCKERKVHVDYKVFTNSYGSGMSQIKVIEELVRCGQKELLMHPLIESLLYLKWRCLLPVVYTIIAIYATFLVSFNVYLVSVFHERDGRNETETPGLKCFDKWNDWMWIVLIYLSISLLFVQECIYIYLRRRRYFVHLESWVKLCLLVLATAVPLGVRCAEPEPWQRHVACAALLLSWLQAMFLLSRFPDWGYYVLMFERVAYNIFKILMTSICLLFGFSFCFMIQYQSKPPFNGPGAAFVKTFVMMSSEFDYEDLFGEDHNAELRDTKKIVRFLFVIFVIFIAIVLMNFMIGVAVSDINELNVIGNIRRLEKQMELQSTLDILIDSTLAKLFTRLLRIKFHHNISKDIESDEKWKVWFGINKWDVDDYEETLPLRLQNAIINVAKKKVERKNYDEVRNEKRNKLDAMYNTLIGMIPNSKQNIQENVQNFSVHEHEINNKKQQPPDLTLKDKIQSLEESNNKMQQSINDLKESVNKVLAIMTTSEKKQRNTW